MTPEEDLRDKLIADKLGKAEVVRLLAKPFMLQIRDNAPIFGVPYYKPRDIKIRKSILDKIQRYRKEAPQLDLPAAVDRIKDFAGCRFVVYYIGDIKLLHQYMCKVRSTRPDVKLDGPCDDCVHDARPTGFRALTQVMQFEIGLKLWFPFEVQIMTFLQHDWDQKHHEIYKHLESIPQSIIQFFKQLSEQLYQADNTEESLRAVVQEFLPQK